VNDLLKSALAKYGDNPPRFLWKHLPRAEQERLVLQSIRVELRWLGLPIPEDVDLRSFLQNLYEHADLARRLL
jgi:hypothetical protein